MALAAGAAVMVTSHLGRPTEGEPKPEDSLAPVAARLGELLGRAGAAANGLGRRRRRRAGRARRARELPPQQGREEERPGAGEEDGGALRRLRQRRLRHRAPRRGVDLRHRRVRAGRLRRAAARRRDRRDHARRSAQPKRPLVAIVAGSQGLDQAGDPAEPGRRTSTGSIVGGGIANTFLLAEGLPIGKSLAEPALVDEARAVIAAMKARGAEVPMPVDVVTATEFKADAPATTKAVADVGGRRPDPRHRPEERRSRSPRILQSAGTIVWNGPVGVFEFDAFAHGTETIARAIAALAGVQPRRRRRHAGGDRQVRHRRRHRLHLDRRRRLPRGARRQDAAGARDPRAARPRQPGTSPA